jgi:peptide/nickel transport system substrate-binding protein
MIEVEPVISSELYGKMRSRTYDSALVFWFPDYFDANTNASAFAFGIGDQGPHSVAWRAGWNNPSLSAKTHAALVAENPAKRATLYAEIQRAVAASSPFLFMLQAKDQVVLSNRVQNYTQGITPDQVYYGRVEKK